MKRKHFLLRGTAALVLAFMILAGCDDSGSDSTPTPSPPTVTPGITGITVAAAGGANSVAVGHTLGFTATLTGPNSLNPPPITWYIATPIVAPGTTLSTTGPGNTTVLIVDTNETSPTIRVRAQCTEGSTVFIGEATVIIVPPNTITYTVKAEGAPTSKLIFTFSEAVNGLADTDITIAPVTGSSGAATKGTVSDVSSSQTPPAVTDTVQELPLPNVTGGEVTVKVVMTIGAKTVETTLKPITLIGAEPTGWTAVPVPTPSIFGSDVIKGIASDNNGTFVAVGGGGKAATSPDGITWSTIDCKFGTGKNINAVVYGNNRFVAVGDGRSAHSANGLDDWHSSPNGVPLGNMNAVTYGIPQGAVSGSAGLFIAVGGQTSGASPWVGYSADGANWTEIIITSLGFTGELRAIAYCSTAGSEMFVAAGDNGQIAYSTDVTTWTQASTFPFSTSTPVETIYGLAWGGVSGSEQFVAVGTDGRFAWSTDGDTWSSGTVSGFGGIISSVACNNSAWVLTGLNGKIGTTAVSTTGIAATTVWKVYPDGPNPDPSFNGTPIYGVAYGGGNHYKWVAVGGSGKMAYSKY